MSTEPSVSEFNFSSEREHAVDVMKAALRMIIMVTTLKRLHRIAGCNPDLTQVDQDGKIVGFGEAKFGKIGKKGREQLYSFYNNAVRVAGYLRSHYADLAAMSLNVCDIVLIVPANKDAKTIILPLVTKK